VCVRRVAGEGRVGRRPGDCVVQRRQRLGTRAEQSRAEQSRAALGGGSGGAAGAGAMGVVIRKTVGARMGVGVSAARSRVEL
jgi:hypothetical protein